MKPLYLDFVRERRHRALLGPVLLAAAAVAGAALIAWYAVMNSALEDLRLREAALARRAAFASRDVPASLDADEARKLAAALRELTTPWEDLLASIEGAGSADVAVLALEQQPAQSSLRVLAEARNPEAMLEYLRRIDRSKALRAAVLESHRVELEEPGQPVRFTLTARYAEAP